MRFVANGVRTLRIGMATAGLLVLTASGALAQLVFDGNLLFNNNATGTLAGQFSGATSAGPTCAVGLTPAQLGTVTYTNNSYADPLLPNAPYQADVVPDWRPAAGSPAFQQAMRLPADGFFEEVCYAGAIGPRPLEVDWTLGWTYYDSTGGTRQDLHLVGMPDPRPLATYANISLYESQTWAADSNYLVRGQLRVKEQATLTIPAGVVVFEERATLGTIIIERGARIIAVGTAQAPIIITSDDAPGTMAVGAGGGLVIHGRAKVNNANSCAGDSAASEGGAVGFYGGNDDDDSSGILRYVRVEYSGKEVTPNNELNAFTFNGVGRGTQIEYLQSHRCADDGVEFFGGTADSKHLIATDGRDDGYDWQMGFRGRTQFVVIRVSPELAPSGTQNGDKAIEADNNEFNHNTTLCSGFSYPTIANFTMVGDKRSGPAFPGVTSGVNLRRGTAGQVLNSIVYNFKTAALRIDDNSTWEHHCAALPAAPAVLCSPTTGVEVASGRVFVARSSPNPFTSQIRFNFSLPRAGDVRVEIFSAAGQRIATLAPGTLAAGEHSLTWRVDRQTPGGVYFYQVRAGNLSSAGKIIRVD